MVASLFAQNSAEKRENAVEIKSNNTFKVSKNTVNIF